VHLPSVHTIWCVVRYHSVCSRSPESSGGNSNLLTSFVEGKRKKNGIEKSGEGRVVSATGHSFYKGAWSIERPK